MTIGLLKTFFMWCSLINVSLLLLGFMMWLCASDRIYALHGRWFPMPRETFNAVFYFLLGLYKIIVFVFNIVPWVSLAIVASRLPRRGG